MSSPSISVVIPVYNGAGTLAQALRALTTTEPAPDEILVVDDGSTDDSAQIAESFGVRVIRVGKNLGAAAAKNCGAQNARGDILFFTDADILVPRDICAQLRNDFAEPSRAGIVGLLDAKIPARDFASQFKNLWMNFTYAHFASSERIGLFYTSAAAIRHDIFLQSGGFDENNRGASIAEDTDFGQRAWAHGLNIRLDPNIRVVHLKKYSIGGVLREDFYRARALVLLRLRKWGQPFFTSVPTFYQIAVPTIYLALFAILLAPFFGIWSLGFSVAALVAFYLLNLPWLRFLFRERGFRFGISSALFWLADALVVGAGMLVALFEFARGKRY